jgi:asparaginyl-tRNA synthetase
VLSSANEVEDVRTKAKADIAGNLTVLEEHLSERTFIVGENITLCDVSLFAAYTAIVELNLINKRAFRALGRWSRSIAAVKEVADVLGGKAEVFRVHTVAASSSSAKWNRHRIRVKELLKEGEAAIGRVVVVKGWIRTSRSAEKGQVIFIELTDGSTVKGIQLVFNMDTTDGAKAVADCGGAGASLSIIGKVVASPAKGQSIEVHVLKAEVLGVVLGGDNGEIGGKNYPMAKKAHTLEFLREKAHLRPRSKVFSSALRVRNAMAFATHKFFNERGFVYVHTPLITAADCEGAGEQFVVTTLLPEEANLKQIPADKNGKVDFSKDFFSRRCCLTVSGQLNVETHACALSDVYTFGPTFRAENSHTARHLAEFWMIEPEICFADLVDDMGLAEDYVKFCTQYALEHCADDLHYFEHEYPQGEKGLQSRLRNVVENDFAKITYTEAIELLQAHIKDGKVQFLVYPQWGDDLGSEHERYITEKVYQKPTIVINYPKGIKAFYMKLNDDKETVAAMDVLVPKIGELIGGSQR